MKLIILALFATAAVVLASPIDKTKINPTFGKCLDLCEDSSNKVLCATDGDKINLSFLNECVLKKYNCERNRILTKKSDGECPNGGGIRII